jgi:hypothetical protein
VGIGSYYYILLGTILLRYYYLSALTRVSRPISLTLDTSDLPVPVLVELETTELFELTEEIEEFKSTILPCKLGLFLNNCARLILKIESVGSVGLDSSKPP